MVAAATRETPVLQEMAVQLGAEMAVAPPELEEVGLGSMAKERQAPRTVQEAVADRRAPLPLAAITVAAVVQPILPAKE